MERDSDEPRLNDAIQRMAKTVDFFFEQIQHIRTGNVTPSVLDSVRIECYGQKTPLKGLAMTTGGRGQPISIKPYDPNMTVQINRDLNSAGFPAYIFSKDTVCVNVPPMSGDEREKIRKHVKKIGEESKVAIRNIRKQGKRLLKGLPDDEKKAGEDYLQEKTDLAISMIDEGIADKVTQL